LTANNPISLLFFNSLEANSIAFPSFLTAYKTRILSFYKFLDANCKALPHFFIAANTIS
jgi:hypothetical protein